MRLLRLIILLLPVLVSGKIKAQYSRSVLLQEIKQARNDSEKVELLLRLSSSVQNNNFIEAAEYARQAIEIAEKNNYTSIRIKAYNALGDAYWYHTDYAKAQAFYFKSYRLSDSINDAAGIANSLYNIGWVVCIQQKNYKEINYLYTSLNYFKQLNDTDGVLRLYNALGNLFTDRYRILKEKPIFDSAMLYYTRSLDLCKTPAFSYKTGTFLGNLGDLLAISGDYRSAKFYSEKSLKYFSAEHDSAGYFLNVANLANYNLHLGEIDKAIDQLEGALRYSLRHDNREVLIYVYKNLNEAYYKKGNIAKAYDYLQKSVVLNDSLNSQIYSSNIKDLQSSYQLEKKESDIKALTQAREIQELKAKQSRFILLGIGVILLIIIVIAYLLYKRNREKNAANLLLQEQNAIISQKKQEIEHSIQYAKGIQYALLPSVKEIKSVFPEGFIYYLPKDVVSGDFYWFHKLGDYFYLVAADCTGHGVPGALMSIVSMDKLAQGIFEKKLSEPKDILRFLNVEIKNSLKQHDDETKQRDGLDLTLLRINIKTNTVDFSAANRPLYIVSRGSLAEYKADKVAIAGFTPDNHDFRQISIQLNKGDCIYLSTDGYADQFGGSESKKFMTRNFKSLLEKIHNLDMNAQEKELINNHLTWKGNYEQVDDILVIGIKI